MSNRSRSPKDEFNGPVEFVTVMIADQWFGIPTHLIHDVFTPQSITPVPLARPEVAGVLNLRGRIVTAIDMRNKLNLAPKPKDEESMAVGIEKAGESYGLIVDTVGEVVSLDGSNIDRNPSNLDPRWKEISKGVCRLDNSLLVIMDVDCVLNFIDGAKAA